MLSVLVSWSALTKHHRLSGLAKGQSLSRSSRGSSPRSRSGRVGFWGALFLACRCHCILIQQREQARFECLGGQMAPQPLCTPGAQGSRRKAHQSEPPLPLSLPVARTRDPQIPRGAGVPESECIPQAHSEQRSHLARVCMTPF